MKALPQSSRGAPASEDPRTFALWRHDQFPYILVGEMIETLPDGSVTVKGYEGARFTPLRLAPGTEGARLQADLEALRAEYRHAGRAFESHWRERARMMAGDAPPR